MNTTSRLLDYSITFKRHKMTLRELSNREFIIFWRAINELHAEKVEQVIKDYRENRISMPQAVLHLRGLTGDSIEDIKNKLTETSTQDE